MILYTNGCSWTYGAHAGGDHPFHSWTDEERLSKLWPHFLGQKLNAKKVVNLSKGCGSNQRIFRTTYDWLNTLTEQECNEVVAVIQFTQISRYEIYLQKNFNENYENITDRWLACKVDSISGSTLDEADSKAHMLLNNQRLSTYTDIEGIYTYITQVIALTKLFELFKVKKFFYWNNNEFVHSPANYCSFIMDNFPFIQKHGDRWNYERVGKVVNTDGSIGFDDHPSLIVGHGQLADIIYDKIHDLI
jgi:hypothetical protein